MIKNALFSSEYANAGQLWHFTRDFSRANMQNIDCTFTKKIPEVQKQILKGGTFSG